jgi:hypothetical protein
MKKIREGVFETNSSSSHSITLGVGEFIPSPLYRENGVTIIGQDEFGWEINDYSDSNTKAAYALTYASGDESLIEMLEKVVRREIGDAGLQMDTECGNGYIDHQSSCIGNSIFESEDTLHRFIFNRASSLHTDNDNH